MPANFDLLTVQGKSKRETGDGGNKGSSHDVLLLRNLGCGDYRSDAGEKESRGMVSEKPKRSVCGVHTKRVGGLTNVLGASDHRILVFSTCPDASGSSSAKEKAVPDTWTGHNRPLNDKYGVRNGQV